MICQICNQEINNALINHLLKYHFECSLQEYFEKYYNIPANKDYIVDESVLWTMVQELQEENALDCISHFKKILEEVNNNVARLQLRLNNLAYEIYHYLNIVLIKTKIRRKKNELQMLQISTSIDHKHHDQRLVTCSICNKQVKYGYILWHMNQCHDIDKKDFLQQTFNLPGDIDYKLITYGLAEEMYNELQKYNNTFNTYKECYQYIYDQFNNNMDMTSKFNYNINLVCKILGIDHNSVTNMSQSYHRTSLNTLPKQYIQGYREDLALSVRSSWEANFARILNFEKLFYTYEKYKFAVIMPDGTKTTYTPDFCVNNTFFEIKGRWYRQNRIKVNMFREQYPQYLTCIIDKNIYNYLFNKYHTKISIWEL